MEKTCDFLVVGSGIAGLCFAIHASSYGKVIIITKKRDIECNTNYAQGGIASVLDPADSFAAHIHDTLNTGNGIANEKVVKMVVENGPDRIKELLNWGADFTKSTSSNAFANLDLAREGGHSAERIVHTYDLTGMEVERCLLEKIKKLQNVQLIENHALIELLTNHHLNTYYPAKTCFGAYIFDTINRKIFSIKAKITFLASGGTGQIYQHTTNPDIATGDGIACAYRAGAQIKNMEFIQFHPTTLYHNEANSFLISEALRGYGAILKNKEGDEFMQKYHPMQSLAPRDIVARAIDNEMKISGEPCVFLDIRHAPKNRTKKRFPTIYAKCKEFGIDITNDLIPVVPASHYLCGGIAVDRYGRSSINNLYAGGEVSCTGVHGANRLASNSLLEALVFSWQSALHVGEKISSVTHISDTDIRPWDDSGTIDNEEWILVSHNRDEIKNVMWDYVGIVRSNLRLERAQRRVRLLEEEIEDFYRRTKISPPLLELRNIITVAKLIILSALRRHESRGLHYTTDYPEKDDLHFKLDTKIQKKFKN